MDYLIGEIMRKIEQWMLEVIKTSRDNAHLMQEQTYNKDNTTVLTRTREDGVVITTVYLHGNMIAQCSESGWGFKMAGWPTPTTKARINAIANAAGHPGVYTRKGKHYSGDKSIDAYQWF